MAIKIVNAFINKFYINGRMCVKNPIEAMRKNFIVLDNIGGGEKPTYLNPSDFTVQIKANGLSLDDTFI